MQAGSETNGAKYGIYLVVPVTWAPTEAIKSFEKKPIFVFGRVRVPRGRSDNSCFQFNSMYVCTLKVAGKQHGIMAQVQRGGNVDFCFLGSQNSASIDRGGGGGDGGNAAPEQQGRVKESEDSSAEEDEDE